MDQDRDAQSAAVRTKETGCLWHRSLSRGAVTGPGAREAAGARRRGATPLPRRCGVPSHRPGASCRARSWPGPAGCSCRGRREDRSAGSRSSRGSRRQGCPPRNNGRSRCRARPSTRPRRDRRGNRDPVHHRARADARAADGVAASGHVRAPRTGQETETDDGDEPHQRQDDRESVEVAFGEARGAESRAHAASEHVGEAPPRPLWSRMSRVSRRLVTPGTPAGRTRESALSKAFRGGRIRPHKRQVYGEAGRNTGCPRREAAGIPSRSDSDVLLVADDGRELVDDEARAAHRAPSTSGSRMNPAMLLDFTDPP